MNAVFIIAQFAIQFGLPAAQELVKLFQKSNPTQADWDAVFALARPYNVYVSAVKTQS